MPNLGAIAIGATAGLGLGVVAAVPLLAGGLDSGSVGGQSVLILLGIAAQFVAGLLAGKVAGRDEELHGGLGALSLFALVASISLAASEHPGLATLVLAGIVALVIGTLGGLLARAQHR